MSLVLRKVWGLRRTYLSFLPKKWYLLAPLFFTLFLFPHQPEQQAQVWENKELAPRKTKVQVEDTSNERRIAQLLAERGYTPKGIAAILGNLKMESGFKPNALEPSTTGDRPLSKRGFGIAQWTDAGRQQNLINFAEQRGVPLTDLEMQVDFLDQEIKKNGRLYRILTGGEGSTRYSVDTLTKDFEENILRPDKRVSRTQDRIAYARDAESRISNMTGQSAGPIVGGKGAAGMGSVPTLSGAPRETSKGKIKVGETETEVSTLPAEVAADTGLVMADGEILGDQRVDLKSMTPEQRKKYRANKLAQYGFVEATLNLDSGRQYYDKDGRPVPPNKVVTLRSVFQQAVQQDWTADRFQAELRKTNWYQSTFDQKRLQQVLQTVDSATFENNIRLISDSIKETYRSYGADAPDEQTIRDLAIKSLYTELSTKDFLAGIANSINFAGESLKGATLQAADLIRKNARAYGINFRTNDTNFQSYVRQRISGELNETDINNQFREQAIKNYPALADRLRAGATLRDIADPYLRVMSEILDIGENDISFDDPLMQSALNGTSPDEDPTTMSLWEFKKAIRKDPRWARTPDAQDKINNALSAVLADFGLVR
jgi:hypothetical protein